MTSVAPGVASIKNPGRVREMSWHFFMPLGLDAPRGG